MTDENRSDPPHAGPDPALRRRIVALMAEVLQCDLEPTLSDVRRESVSSWDSFNHIHLVLALEEGFQISISDDEAAGMASLRDIERILAVRGVTRSARPSAGENG